MAAGREGGLGPRKSDFCGWKEKTVGEVKTNHTDSYLEMRGHRTRVEVPWLHDSCPIGTPYHPAPIPVTTTLITNLVHPSTLGGLLGHTINAAARFMTYPEL